MVSSVISTWTPVRVGSESSRPAAMATCATAVANVSLVTVPVVSGSSGRFGYSESESVGRVNFAAPDVTSTRVPSSVMVIGLLGSDRQISASSFPGTNTAPFSTMSALKWAFEEVSKSEPLRNTSSPVASIFIPRSSVLIGRVERLRETQLTPSVSEC